jgi:hypothetical protein
VSKLLQRLQDAARSGVYRARRREAIDDAVRGSRLHTATISLKGGKEAMLDCIARALDFPDWFGRNWDALEDCLSDLSWRQADGTVLVFTGFTRNDDLGILLDVLASSAESWAERGKPFFAVFIDPRRSLDLPPLYRGA